jgi:alanyl-tRNA synthetase
MSALQRDLARYHAEELAASAETIRLAARGPSEGQAHATDAGKIDDHHARLVAHAVDADANGLKTLAAAIVARPGYLVVLVSAATPALVVVARSADVGVPVQQLLTSLIQRFGGRGGGRPELAQGGGLDAPPEAILDAARAAIQSVNTSR